MQKNRIDIVYATYPGLINLYLGNHINYKYGKPWIAEFRDIGEQRYYHSLCPKHINRAVRLEQHLVNSASMIVTVTSTITKILEGRHSQQIEIIYKMDLNTTILTKLI